MSTVIAESNSLAADYILSGSLPVPLPRVEPGLRVCFDLPTFQLQLRLPITDIDPDFESGRVIFKVAFDEVILILTVSGKLNRDQGVFQIEHINLHMERAEENARADFIISTIRAAIVLAGDIHLRIPDAQVDITLRFNEPLLEISQMLRRRQIDYRVMVIEQTIGHEFHLPLDISGDEVRDITLAYHAIIDRSFFWSIDSITVFFPATKEWADTLSRLRQETSIPLGPDPFYLELFGYQIDLGQRGIIIQDAVIENFEVAQKEISEGDERVVPVIIRSTSGQARYDFFGAPEPPAIMWEQKIQRLVGLESQLDIALVNRYHALAASTIEGLTEEEKIAITARPELDEGSF